MKLEKASGFDLSISFFGFALFWAYRWMFFNTNALIPASYRGTLLIGYAGTFGALLQALVVAAVVIALLRGFAPLVLDRNQAVVAVLLGTIATPLIVSNGYFPEPVGDALSVVGWASREIASGILVCMWAKVFCSASERNVCIYMSVSVAVAALLVVVLAYLPQPITLVCTSLMPIGSVALLYMARGKLKPNEPELMAKERRMSDVPLLAPSTWRLLVAIFVYAVVFAVGLSEVTNRLAQDAQTTVSLAIAGNFLGGLIIAVIVLVMPKMSAIARVYQFTLPIMVLSLVLMNILGDGYLSLIDIALSLGFTLFDIVSWIVLIDLAHYTKTSVLRAFLFGRVFSLLGMFVGRLFSLFILSQAPNAHDTILGAFLLVAAFVLVLVVTVVVHERNLFYNERLSDEIDQEFLDARKAEDEGGDAPEAGELQDYWRAKIDAVVTKYELTPRESEVLALLARGRTNAFIQDELVISKHTVDTHVIHIYRKCGVHSKQEMLTLIEETSALQQQ